MSWPSTVARLQRLSSLLDESTREGDIACRYGGDEFVLVLPGTTLSNAIEKAETLRRAAAGLDFENRTGITISVGISCSTEHGTEGGRLLVVADRALYQAKRGGRNQVQAGPISHST